MKNKEQLEAISKPWSTGKLWHRCLRNSSQTTLLKLSKQMTSLKLMFIDVDVKNHYKKVQYFWATARSFAWRNVSLTYLSMDLSVTVIDKWAAARTAEHISLVLNALFVFFLPVKENCCRRSADMQFCIMRLVMSPASQPPTSASCFAWKEEYINRRKVHFRSNNMKT